MGHEITQTFQFFPFSSLFFLSSFSLYKDLKPSYHAPKQEWVLCKLLSRVEPCHAIEAGQEWKKLTARCPPAWTMMPLILCNKLAYVSGEL